MEAVAGTAKDPSGPNTRRWRPPGALRTPNVLMEAPRLTAALYLPPYILVMVHIQIDRQAS
jgi:hypothetical protein